MATPIITITLVPTFTGKKGNIMTDPIITIIKKAAANKRVKVDYGMQRQEIKMMKEK